MFLDISPPEGGESNWETGRGKLDEEREGEEDEGRRERGGTRREVG